MRVQRRDGNFELSHMDEFIDGLLREERVNDIQLPRYPNHIPRYPYHIPRYPNHIPRYPNHIPRYPNHIGTQVL